MLKLIGGVIKYGTVGFVAIHCFLYVTDKEQFNKNKKLYLKCPPIKKSYDTTIKHLELIKKSVIKH